LSLACATTKRLEKARVVGNRRVMDDADCVDKGRGRRVGGRTAPC
jgi:hypothetical protein